MADTDDVEKKPRIPEVDAVKRLRERYEERKSGIRPSPEMDEIVKKRPDKREEQVRKIAKPKRDSDLDL